MANWTIDIVSKAGTTYKVIIGGFSEARTLVGASEPITIDEDDNDDFFTPVRCASGNIRFWDETGILWRLINPGVVTAMPVRITTGNTVVWRGYVQGDTLSGEFPPRPSVHSIPVACPLTILGGINFNPASRADGVTNFAYALQHILTLSNFQWPRLYFAGHEGNILQRLRARYDLNNFHDGETPQYTCLEVLEEICKFFNWQCRLQGDDIYFTSFGDSELRVAGYTLVTWQQLAAIATSTYPVTLTHFDFQWADLEVDNPLTFADTDGEELLTATWRKVTVKADINPKGNILEVPTTDIVEQTRNNAITDIYYKGSASKAEVGVKNLILDKNYQAPANGYQQGNWKLQELERTTSWVEIAEYYEGRISYNNQLNLKSPTLCMQRLTSGSPLSNTGILLSTATPITVPEGMLVVSAKTWVDRMNASNHTHQQRIHPALVLIQLSIGDWYWKNDDGHTSSWVYQPSEDVYWMFNTGTIDSDEWKDGTGYFFTTKRLNDGYAYFDGMGVPIGHAMTGILRLRIIGFYEGSDWPSGDYLELQRKISDIKVSFAPKLWGTDNDGDANTYTSYNFTQSKGEKSISTIFATHNNNSKDGKGYLFDVQGNYLEYLLFYDSEFRPEQRTADVIAQFGATHRSMVNATIFSLDLASVTPRDGVIFNGNRNYCVLSRSWDFWNDTVKIKAIEI